MPSVQTDTFHLQTTPVIIPLPVEPIKITSFKGVAITYPLPLHSLTRFTRRGSQAAPTVVAGVYARFLKAGPARQYLCVRDFCLYRLRADESCAWRLRTATIAAWVVLSSVLTARR